MANATVGTMSSVDGFVTVWALTGPLIGGLLGAGLTAWNQRRIEDRRGLAAIAAENRQANRDRYIDLLTFSTDALNAYSDWARAADAFERLLEPDMARADNVAMHQQREAALNAVLPYLREGPSRATITRATAAGTVADRFDAFLALLHQPGPEHELRRLYSGPGLAVFDEVRGPNRVFAVDERIGALDQALVELRDAISHALVTDAGPPQRPARLGLRRALARR